MKAWLLAAMTACSMALIPQAQAEDSPRVVVEQAVNQIIEILKSREDSTRLTEENRAAISAAIADHFDYRKMARGSIGKSWRELAEEDKVEFSKVFRELLERSYGNRLAGYRDQTIRYEDAKVKKHKALLKSWVVDAQKEIPVYYRLYEKDGRWRVYDIKIEGVSLVGTYRKQFRSALKNGGFRKLLASLRDKVAELKAKDQA